MTAFQRPIRLITSPATPHFGIVRASPAPTPEPANTFGWDTVFALRIADVNAELRKPGVSPAGFEASLPNVCTVAGTFGAWQIAVGDAGGDGTLLRMQAAVRSGKLSFKGTDYDIANSTVLFDVELTYIDHPEVKLPSGQRRTLQVRTTPPSPSQQVVHVTDFTHPNDLVRALAIAAMPVWFNTHLDAFAHVFATVDLNVILQQQHLRWLAPSFTGYAYHNGPDERGSYLGVLSMTSAGSAGSAVSALSAVAIPEGQRAGFLISPALMLSNLFLPSLLNAFPGSRLADYVVKPSGPQIANTGDIALATVTHNGIDYHPVMEWMELTVDGNGLRLSARTRIEISPGIVSYVKQTSFHQIRLVNRGDGTQTLTLVEAQAAESDHWTDVATGLKILADVLIIIGIIVELVLAALTGGAALVIGGIIIGLLFGLASSTPDLIAAIAGGAVSDKSPAIDMLVDAASATIAWQGSKSFRIGSAALAGSFVMGGDPLFAH